MSVRILRITIVIRSASNKKLGISDLLPIWIISKILFPVDEHHRNRAKHDQVNQQHDKAERARALAAGDGADHGAGLGKGQQRYDLSESGGHLVGREEGVTQERHGHDDVGGKARGVGVALGQERQHQRDGGKYRAV